MTRTRLVTNLSRKLVKPAVLLLACCALLAISACANQNYRKAEDLYQGHQYNEAYTYIEQALRDNPENTEYLKLEAIIRKGLYHRNFLGFE